MDSSTAKKHEADISLYHLAENLAYTVCSNPNLLYNAPATPGRATLREKLLHLYLQQFSQQPQTNFATNPRACPNLLSKLVAREKLNTLVIHLKSVDEGYSICLKSSGNLVETANMPYTDRELLNFIEQEELPHNLVDLLEQAQPDLFYDGCVIAEVRDSRRAIKGAYKTSYILLKPSQRSLLADINALTNDQFRWSQDDRLALESKLLLATSEPLCLDPTPAVSIIRNRLIYKKKVALSEEIRRAMRPYTTGSILRRKALSKISCHRDLPLMAFLEKRGDKPKYPYARDSHIKTPVVDSWRRVSVDLSPVAEIDIQKVVKERSQGLSAPKLQSNDCTPVVVEEYAIETERPVGKSHRSHLVILKNSSDDRFIGELHIDRSEGDTNRCTFELGTAPLKDKYISQFIEIFTEEGRRQVKITHTKAGQAPSVAYTTGPNNSGNATPKSSQSQIRFSAAGAVPNQSTIRFSADNLSAAQITADGLSSRGSVDGSQSVSRFTVDNQPAIKFSLTSQPGSFSLSTSVPPEESIAAGQSISSNESSGASLMLGRQGLKIQGGVLPSPQTPQPEPMAISAERAAVKDQLSTATHLLRTSTTSTSSKQLADSLSKTAPVMCKVSASLTAAKPAVASQIGQLTTKSAAAQGPVVQLSSGNQPTKLIGIQTPSTSSTTVSLQNIAGIQTVQGLHNVQVSLTSLGQGGIAVPVSLLSGMSGNQPIFLPLSMMDNSTSNQQTSVLGQSSSSSSRSVMVTTQAGANQQLLAGHQGLITLPVASNLAQQILAANKRQQQVNVVNTQQIANQQLSSQVLTNQQGSQQTAHIATNQKQSNLQLGQLLANQQVPIQIGHLPANQQSSNVQIAHQIITQNTGMRVSQSATTRPSSLQVFHQPSVASGSQINSSQINIITTQAAGGQQILHIPQNLAIAHIGQQGRLSTSAQARLATPAQQARLATPTQQQARLATPTQQQARLATPSQQQARLATSIQRTRLTIPGQARFTATSQQPQKILFRQLGSPDEFQQGPPDS